MAKASLLIVEDDAILAKQLELFFKAKGYQVATAGTKERTLEILKSFTPQVCILDLGLPPYQDSPVIGLDLLPSLVATGAKVIVLTGQMAREAAVKAIAQGAFDFIYKPAEPQVLELAVTRALFLRDIEKEIQNQEGREITIHRNPEKEEENGTFPLEGYLVSQGLNELKTKFERELVEKALESTGFNIVKTARLLKVSRESLYYLMKKHGIKRPP